MFVVRLFIVFIFQFFIACLFSRVRFIYVCYYIMCVGFVNIGSIKYGVFCEVGQRKPNTKLSASIACAIQFYLHSDMCYINAHKLNFVFKFTLIYTVFE